MLRYEPVARPASRVMNNSGIALALFGGDPRDALTSEAPTFERVCQLAGLRFQALIMRSDSTI